MGRTPRELLASVTSADVTEMLAFERLEPFGSLHLESVIGSLCALLANINRKEHSAPFTAVDFMPALRRALRSGAPDKPVLLDDPEQQSMLIKASLFGVKVDTDGE